MGIWPRVTRSPTHRSHAAALPPHAGLLRLPGWPRAQLRADGHVWACRLHGTGLRVTLPTAPGTPCQTEASVGWVLSSSPQLCCVPAVALGRCLPQSCTGEGPLPASQLQTEQDDSGWGGVRGDSRGPQWGLPCRVLDFLLQVQARTPRVVWTRTHGGAGNARQAGWPL